MPFIFIRIIIISSSCFGEMAFHKRKENSGTQKCSSASGRTEYSSSFVFPQDKHIIQLPSKIRACVFKRCRVIQPGTWESNQGEKDFWMQCKEFLPGTGGTAREAPLPEWHEMPGHMCSDCQQSAQCVQN